MKKSVNYEVSTEAGRLKYLDEVANGDPENLNEHTDMNLIQNNSENITVLSNSDVYGAQYIGAKIC